MTRSELTWRQSVQWYALIWWETLAGTWRSIGPAVATPKPIQWSNDKLTAAWLGHSTVLINFFGVTVLTDPVLYDRIGLGFPFFTIGPKRLTKPALCVADLPPIDVILLSHAHFDHFDVRTLACFDHRTQVITATKTADLLPRSVSTRKTELQWGECHSIQSSAGNLLVTAFEVNHYSPRLRSDTYRGHNGYLLERGGRRVIFSGDTALTESFTKLPGPQAYDVAIMSIGAYKPWIQLHCTPEQAISMANAASAYYIIPVHHQTFRLSFEPFREPIDRFTAALQNTPDRVALRAIGETFVLPAAGAL